MHCSGAGRRPESKHLKREQQWMIVVTLLGGEKVILLSVSSSGFRDNGRRKMWVVTDDTNCK